MQNEKDAKIEQLAKDILHLSRDNILMNMRFLDVALSRMQITPYNSLKGMAADGSHLYYDPAYLLRTYKREPAYISRSYLHSLLHLVFFHPFGYDKVNKKYWDVAVDIAVENSILEMKTTAFSIRKDAELKAALEKLKNNGVSLTAEKIYKYFLREGVTEEYLTDLRLLFRRDEHTFWNEPEQMNISLADWKKLSQRIRTDLKTFSKDKGNSEAMEQNLAEATKDRYDYRDILKRFTVMGEEIKPNDEEFDYIYYTYGLNLYGNVPMVEPLEYKDIKKVKEFVIAIDTSASCRGKIVRNFLNKTYSILKGSENFFTRIHVHIVQCDHEVQSDTVITCEEDFDEFIKNGKLSGFGATDFRPVFDYVNQLILDDTFEKLKGLIYFTDGYGVYPEQMPEYDVIFAFLNEDERRPKLPVWAIQVVLEEEELEEDETDKETGEEAEIEAE